MKYLNKCLGLLGLLVLAGCISGTKHTDTYTDNTGKTTVIESDNETCTRACNEDYSRCMDTLSAQDNSGVNGPRGMFGANADCRRNLKDCLPGCQAR